MFDTKLADELSKAPHNEESFAEVKHFDVKDDVLDDEDEPMLGYYWRIVDWDYAPLTELIGPYFDVEEAVEAAKFHWSNNTWADC